MGEEESEQEKRMAKVMKAINLFAASRGIYSVKN
jgi:hypothetical protein